MSRRKEFLEGNEEKTEVLTLLFLPS